MISVVIVNWNSGPFLEKCARSLLRNTHGTQIIVVDNASTDASLRFAQDLQGSIAILRNRKNLGFAAANNIGWQASNGTHILFLNPDIECFPESVDLLKKTLDADSAVWAAGGRLVGPSGRPQTGFNLRPFPTVRSVAAEMVFLDEIWPSNPWSGYGTVKYSLEADVDQPAAACLMVCREALEVIDGFDEDFRPAWFEDVDLCRRIRNEGGRIRYQPEAQFLHHGGHSLEKLSRQEFLESFHRNQIRYFRKHHGARSAARVRRWIIAGLLLRSAISIAYPLAPNLSRAASVKAFLNTARFIAGQHEGTL